MGDPVLAGGALDRVHRPRPAWGPFFMVAAAVAGGCAAAFFLERARFGTRRVPVARGRVPKPGRRLGGNCCACGGIFLYGCVPVGTLDKGALYRAGGRFGLWFSGRIYPDERAASLDCLGCILRRHSFQHDFYSHLRGRGVPAARPRLGGAAGQRFCHCAGALAVYHGAASGRGVCAGACGLAVCLVCCAGDWYGLGGKKSFAVVLGVTAGSLVVTFLLVLLLMPGLAGSLQRHLEVLLAPDANAAGAGYWMNALRRMWDGMRWLGPGDGSLPLGEKAALGTVGEFAGKAVRELRADYLLAYAGWRYGIACAAALAAAVAARWHGCGARPCAPAAASGGCARWAAVHCSRCTACSTCSPVWAGVPREGCCPF